MHRPRLPYRSVARLRGEAESDVRPHTAGTDRVAWPNPDTRAIERICRNGAWWSRGIRERPDRCLFRKRSQPLVDFDDCL